MSQPQPVGISQRIQLPWLEYTASLTAVGQDRDRINAALQEMLLDRLSVGGDAKRGTREKAISILMKIWVTVPSELLGLRNDGLTLLQTLPPREHLAVHWGMTMAVYPFWGNVADATGRLLRLQDRVTAAEVQRRVRERFGERETVARAARRVLRAYMDWGVLKESGNKGDYLAVSALPVRSAELALWLLEATLRASGQTSANVEVLLTQPSLFPLSVQLPRKIFCQDTCRLELVRQSPQDYTVNLKNHPINTR